MPDPDGATVIGTRTKTTADMAAFVNGTMARYPEFIDSYHGPGSGHGHVSEVIAPVLAAAEHVRASGRDFITAVVVAYEVFIRISDVFHNNHAFDSGNLGCIGSAAAASKLFGLTHEQIAHAISMAVVPNNILHQVSRDHKTMFKSVAAGQAGRAGVFAAMLARAGMEGPHLPFEGKARVVRTHSA
jgi:2-methylcitrate dehydratase